MPTAYPVMFDGVASAKPVGYDPARTALPVWFRQKIGGLHIIATGANVYSGSSSGGANPFGDAYAEMLADTTLGSPAGLGSLPYRTQISEALSSALAEVKVTQIRLRSIREFDSIVASSKVNTWADTFLSCVDSVKFSTAVSFFGQGNVFSAVNLQWGLTETKPESGAEAISACNHSEYVGESATISCDMTDESKTLDNLVQSDYDYNATGEFSKPVWLVRFLNPEAFAEEPFSSTYAEGAGIVIKIVTSAY
jgi:hypothetical protein